MLQVITYCFFRSSVVWTKTLNSHIWLHLPVVFQTVRLDEDKNKNN